MGEKRRNNREITQLHKIQQIYPKEDPRTTIINTNPHKTHTNPHKSTQIHTNRTIIIIIIYIVNIVIRISVELMLYIDILISIVKLKRINYRRNH